MRSVVITGSARGLGFEMAKVFSRKGCNVIISDIDEEMLKDARREIKNIENSGLIYYYVCDVTKSDDIRNLIGFAKEKFDSIDIWINNAGVNQPEDAIWELKEEEINLVFDVDLRGAVLGSKLIMEEMVKNHRGAIYNVEGYGSNDAMVLGLSVYGTSKRAITYFTQALAKESKEKKTGVIIGRLSPGIMITNFITTALGNKEKINLSEKTKRIYNVLGDYPSVVAEFLVNKMLKNKKNNVKIEWLTNTKAAWRFITSGFNKRNFFVENKTVEVFGENDSDEQLENDDNSDFDILVSEPKIGDRPYKRRLTSNGIIESQGITCYENLPMIEDSSEIQLKDEDIICKRAIACLISTQLACDLDRDKGYEETVEFAKKLLDKYEVEDSLLDIEKKLFSGNYTKQDVIDVTWTYEVYWCLVWALGLIDKLKFPGELCDVEEAIKLVAVCEDYDSFKEKCKIRDIEEILDAIDLYYRYHWACVEKTINSEACIGKLNPEVVIERRRGLEWLVHEEEDWNDITLDT